MQLLLMMIHGPTRESLGNLQQDGLGTGRLDALLDTVGQGL
jgi:hypothetical protein